MERIKPIELEHTVIPKRFWGYDVEFVNKLLKQVTKEIESLLKELKDTSDIAKTVLQEVEHFRIQENTLKDALILAQKTADETKAHAHKEAELILKEAQQKAESMETKIYQENQELVWKTNNLKQHKKYFEQRWEKLLEEQLLFIKNFSDSEINTESSLISENDQT